VTAAHEGADSTPRLQLHEVEHGERAPGVPIVRRVDVDLAPGRLVVLLGRSGSGKSTLCQLVAGLEAPDRGEVLLDGRPAHEVHDWAELALLPQRFGLPPELTVTECVSLPAWLRGRTVPADLLEDLDLVHLADRLTSEASRGEQQRVALGRAAVLGPRVLVADEPTSHQDEAHTVRVLGVLAAAAAAGSLVVVATHDERIAEAADEVIRLTTGPTGDD
jgi:ABC-type lipoprotein export system ATPase subunit